MENILTLKKAKELMDKNRGNLDLRYTKITKLPDNLTVGGYLNLIHTNITKLPDNLTIGGYLDLRHTNITKLPDNLTVGGSIILPNGNFLDFGKYKRLNQGDYIPNRYLYADYILTHVKRTKKVGNYTFYIGKIKGKNVLTDGTHYAHCSSIKEGIADLIFKSTADRGADQYKELTLDSSLKTEDAIAMYRIITGACKQGTQRFLDSLTELKDSYTVQEIINLTAGQYGAKRFKEFFCG